MITKIVPLGAPDTALLHDVTTRFVELNMYKTIDITIYFTKGLTGTKEGIIKILGKAGENGEAKPISFREKMKDGVTFTRISDGIKNFTIDKEVSQMFNFRVTTEDLIKGGFDRVAIEIPGLALSDVHYSIFGILYSPRYTE